jgi:membrane associated rhomboid family serine protease
MRYSRPALRIGRRLTPAVTWLIGINIATFLLYAFAGEEARQTLARWLVLTPGALLDLHVWKLVTTTLFTTSPLAFILDVLVLWLFMPFLENEWGTRRFLRFAAATSIIGNAVAAVLGLAVGGVALAIPIAGLAPFIYAALVAYGVQFGDRQIQFFGVIPMKGRTLAIGISVVVVLAALLNGRWVEGGGHVAAMLAAYLMVSGRFNPRLWLLQRRHARIRRRLSVLDGGASKKQWLN